MDHFRSKLIDMFGRQQTFAAGYSPLYSRLFGLVATWLLEEDTSQSPFAKWLLEAAQGRRTLDVTLLLAAGLHRDVLRGVDQVAELARYYPTAGGTLPPDNPGFERILREAVKSRSTSLTKFIRQAEVQTNETGRGLCWVLPTMLTGWQSIHLVDLGASAGLNLVADLRSFRLVDRGEKVADVWLGRGQSAEFTTHCSSAGDLFERLADGRLPSIMSRTGCDASPFTLESEADEITLKSFIWGDQVERMDRLCEGIDAYRRTRASAAPVHVYRCELPQNLAQFLESHLIDKPTAPVVVYNTYMTPYLEDKGGSLVKEIGRWASRQTIPVLWLQWEPARDGRRAPVDGWIAWTADMWRGECHQRWHLGWVHPHGGEAVFEGDWEFGSSA